MYEMVKTHPVSSSERIHDETEFEHTRTQEYLNFEQAPPFYKRRREIILRGLLFKLFLFVRISLLWTSSPSDFKRKNDSLHLVRAVERNGGVLPKYVLPLLVVSASGRINDTHMRFSKP
ncbi:hypothetical protein TNCT_352891 [Trichonephila clavata]|uniref:Uncharacterized protein n=1 Tax=Trichonephila clavata TaxID=2740835 RepID=A0A8X6M345_TRICU|nr:hypothetical protein TNCT_352891 [Trichonephila clavata]